MKDPRRYLIWYLICAVTLCAGLYLDWSNDDARVEIDN